MRQPNESESAGTAALMDAEESLRRLMGAACLINSLTSVKKVLETVTHEARDIIGAHQANARMMLPENEARTMQASSCSDKYGAARMPDLPPLGTGLDTLVNGMDRPLRLTAEELAVHPVWRNSPEARNHPGRGLLAVSLTNAEGRRIGVLQLTDKDGGEFHGGDEFLLAQFARIASIALENAGLYQSLQAANQTLLQRLQGALLQAAVSESFVQSSNLHQSLRKCAEVIAEHIGAECVHVWVLQNQMLEMLAATGPSLHLDRARFRIPVGQSTIGRIAMTRQPYLTNSVLDDPHLHDQAWAQREGLTGFAGYPLLCEGKVEGVIALYDHKPFPAAVFEALPLVSRVLAQGILRNRGERNEPHPGPSAVFPGDAGMRAEHAIITHTLDGVISAWNAGAEQLFGYARTEAIGQSLAILVPHDGMDEHWASLERVGRGQTASRPEAVRLHKTGKRIEVRLTTAPLGNTAVTVAHDISAARLLEHQYLQAQRMEPFSRLARSIAHDFNNQLTVIVGYADLLLNRHQPTEAMGGLLTEIYKAGGRAEALTRQLLAFSRKPTAEPTLLDLNAVVRDSEKMLRRLLGAETSLTTVLTPNLETVRADSGQMELVLLNLATNLQDANPTRRRLSIETSNVVLDASRARYHPHAQPGPYVMLALSDAASDTRPAAFELTQRGSEPVDAPNLGVMMVQGLLRQNGGLIQVEQTLDGSTFRVYLPQAPATPPPALKTPADTRAMPPGSETILLVEDEESIRQYAHRALQICGYNVVQASNGQDAIVAAHQAGAIDLLVSDLNMPILGGLELAKFLRAANPHLKVLFLSGGSSEMVLENEPEAAFLQKPFTTKDLAKKVREVLDEA